MAAQEKTPTPVGAGAGAEQNTFNKLRLKYTATRPDDALSLLREMQRVVAGMATTADRLDRTGRALIGGAR